MTTAILTTRHRTDLLGRFLDSFFATTTYDKVRLLIVVDDCPETVEYLKTRKEGMHIIVNERNLEHWQSINRALEEVGDTEPFFWFGKDALFYDGWFDAAMACFNALTPAGCGLVSFKDDLNEWGNADHGLLTKRWLWVLNGYYHFPRDYVHWFCDSELTVRSKDLGRYTYCAASHVAHLHEPSGISNFDMHPDYLLKEARHVEWWAGGLREAKARLKALET